MRQIHKYSLNKAQGDVHKVEMPMGAVVLANSVILKNRMVVFYAEVNVHGENELNKKQWRTFELYWTGQTLREDESGRTELSYMNTIDDGDFVWHLYERITLVRIGSGSRESVRSRG